MNMYCIKDIKSGAYLPPFPALYHSDATRQTTTQARRPGTTLADYPEDFEVYHVGSFDEQSGTMKPIRPEFLTSVSALVQLSTGGQNEPSQK